MTEPNDELTIAEVERIADTKNWLAITWGVPGVRRMAKALLASQKALRSGCQGCANDWPLVAQRDTLDWLHVIDPGDALRYCFCELSEGQRAALIKKGESDGKTITES